MSGHNALKEWSEDWNDTLIDPGDAGALPISKSGMIAFDSTVAGGETRTLAAPASAGLMLAMVLRTDGGTVVVTAAHNVDGSADGITFDNAGDWILLQSIPVSKTAFEWRQVANIGAAVA